MCWLHLPGFKYAEKEKNRFILVQRMGYIQCPFGCFCCCCFFHFWKGKKIFCIKEFYFSESIYKKKKDKSQFAAVEKVCPSKYVFISYVWIIFLLHGATSGWDSSRKIGTWEELLLRVAGRSCMCRYYSRQNPAPVTRWDAACNYSQRGVTVLRWRRTQNSLYFVFLCLFCCSNMNSRYRLLSLYIYLYICINIYMTMDIFCFINVICIDVNFFVIYKVV